MKRDGEVRILDADIDALKAQVDEIKSELIVLKIDSNKAWNELRLEVQNLKIKTGLNRGANK